MTINQNELKTDFIKNERVFYDLLSMNSQLYIDTVEFRKQIKKARKALDKAETLLNRIKE